MAVHLQIFDLLTEEPQTIPLLANDCLYMKEVYEIFTFVKCCRNPTVPRRSDSYSCSEAAKVYLCTNQPAYIGALIDMEVENFLTPQKILASLRDDKPSVYESQDVWASHSEDMEQAANFTAAMHSISTGPAIALAEQVFWKDIHHILDVGAGSGALSIALLQTYPHIKSTLMDIPSVCNIASQYLFQYGVHERSEVIAFDMFSKTSPIHRT